MPDVRMPDGTIIRNVPPGTTRAQLMDRLNRAKNAPDRNGAVGYFDTALRGANDMLTFGMGDKIAAAANAVLPVDKITNPNIKSVWETGSLGDAFRNNLHEEQRIANEDSHDRPWIRGGGQVVGAVMGPVPGRNLIAKGAANIAKSAIKKGVANAAVARTAAGAARIAGEGAVQGGLHGLGEGDSTSIMDRLSEGARQAVQGGLGSLIGAGVVRGAANMVSPVIKPAIAKLADMGVIMTPGQRAGARSLTNWIENVGESVPLLGVAIRDAKRRGLEQFNLGTINHALQPIGAKLPKSADAGRHAVEAAQELISNHYDDALGKIRAPVDDLFQTSLAATAKNAMSLPPEQAQAFNFILQNKIAPLVNGKHALDGRSLQDVSRTLQSLAADADKTPVTGQLLGDQLRAVRQHFLDLAGRHSPQGTQAFLKANQAEANMHRVYDAATAAKDNGIFTPQQLATAAAKRGYGTTKKSAAAGLARMQDIADAAKSVLPNTVPNSGTAERAAAIATLGGIGTGTFAVNPALATLAAPATPYLPGIDAMIQKFALRGQGKAAKAAAKEIRDRAYIGGIFGAPIALQVGN